MVFVLVLSVLGMLVLGMFFSGMFVMGGTAVVDKTTEFVYGGKPSQAIIREISPQMKQRLRQIQREMQLSEENYEVTLAALHQIGFDDVLAQRAVEPISTANAHKAGEDIYVPNQEGFKLYVASSKKKNVFDDYILILYYEKDTRKLANIYVNALRNHETCNISPLQELGVNLYKYGKVNGSLKELELTDSVINKLKNKSKHPDTVFVLNIDSQRGVEAAAWDYVTLNNTTLKLK